jgi:uncharacterized membrane-anchored protein
MTNQTSAPQAARTMLNKVPEVTVFFWLIKIMATTVGETFADYLNVTLGFGLNKTSVVMTVLLLAALVAQFATRKYIPITYWLAVVLISVVGTLITDNLTDNLGLPLQTATLIFALCLAVVFALWFASEKTLSIHSIVTSRRESFYWLTILFTFALGTAAGDLFSETYQLGYGLSALIFGALIAVVAIARYRLGVSEVTTFWAAYILTRPLGASIGDYMSQAKEDSGIGLGTTTTSAIFLVLIFALVGYLSFTRVDATEKRISR